MSLFSDIYNTVAKFFRGQDEQTDNASKSVATNRLKLVLMQDRTNLTPKILEQMRGELIDLLSRYVELDKDLLDLNFEQEGNQVALMLSIPVIRAKDEEEIEAAIKKHNEAIENVSSDNDVSDSEINDNDAEVDTNSDDIEQKNVNEDAFDSESVSGEELPEESENKASHSKKRHDNVSAPEDIASTSINADEKENVEITEN